MRGFGYFLYYCTSDGFIIPCKIYSNLASAKKSNKIDKSCKGAWFIVPLKYAFDESSPIKCMFMNGSWSTDIDDFVANAFYEWRNR